MKKPFRILGLLAGGLLALLLGVALAVPVVLDSDGFRESVRTSLSAQLGREVTFRSLRISVLPQAAVTVEDLRVAGPTPDQPLVSAQTCRLRVALGPLLDKRLEVEAVELHAPHLRALRDGDGRWELSTLGDGGPAPAEPAPDSGTLAPTVVSVARVSVRDGTVEVVDGRSGQTVTVSALEVDARDLGAHGVGRLELRARLGQAAFTVSGGAGAWAALPWDAPLDVRVSAEPVSLGVVGSFLGSAAPVDLARSLLGGTLALRGEGKGVLEADLALHAEPVVLAGPSRTVSSAAALSGHVALARAARSVALSDVKASLGGLACALAGTLQPWDAADPAVDLKAEGLRVAWAEVRPVLEVLGVSLPAELGLEGAATGSLTATGNARKLSAVASMELGATRLRWGNQFEKPAAAALPVRVQWTGDLAAFSPWALRVGATLSGATVHVSGLTLTDVGTRLEVRDRTVTLKELAARLGGGTLGGDVVVKLGAKRAVDVGVDLHADRLDVDALLASPESRPATASAAAEQRGGNAAPVSVHGKLRAERLTYRGREARDVVAQLRLEDGKLRVEPVTGKLASGSFAATTAVDLAGGTHASDLQVTDMDVSALAGTGAVTGRLTADFHGRGPTGDTAGRGLAGQGNLDVQRAHWVGGDVFNSLVPAVSTATGARLTFVNLANIQRIHGPCRVDKGVLSTEALTLERDNGATVLRGTVGMDGALDLHGMLGVNADVIAKLDGDWGFLQDRKGNVQVPFALTGTLSSPVLVPDAVKLTALYARWQAGQHLRGVLRNGDGAGGNSLTPTEEKALETGTGMLLDVLGGLRKSATGKKPK